jgi:AcrR family transcriptional regulator
MPSGTMFDGDAEDTEAALMAATYEALCKHGYADLTIEKIGEEFDKSTSLLYHHYDGKDDLLVAFLGYVLDQFEADVPSDDVADSWSELQGLLDHVLAPTLDAGRREFTKAMVELRAQAAHRPAYRAAFTRHDQFFHDRLTTVVREGVERGEFTAVDPERVAAVIQTAFNGAMVQRVTTDPDDGGVPVEAVRRELEAMLDRHLRRTDAR